MANDLQNMHKLLMKIMFQCTKYCQYLIENDSIKYINA